VHTAHLGVGDYALYKSMFYLFTVLTRGQRSACVCVCVSAVVMGRRVNGDGQSMTSASSSRRSAVDPPQSAAAAPSSSTGAPGPPAARKTGRLFSLRRVIQDVQQQRLGSSRRQRRSTPGDSAPATAEPAPPPTPADSGWYTPRSCRSVEALNTDALSSTATGDDLSDCGTLLDCTLCALQQPRSCFARVTGACGHYACVDCLRRYLSIEIMESRVNVECPACPERLHPNDIRRLLGNEAAELLCKYEEFALRRLLVHDPDARWCPAPDCGYVIPIQHLIPYSIGTGRPCFVSAVVDCNNNNNNNNNNTAKTAKYAYLRAQYVYQPVSVENLGPFSSSILDFLRDLGRRISRTSGDDREVLFLFQRISVTIQRFNSVLLHDSFSVDRPDH